MNNKVRQLIRKLIQEASKPEENEYYIDSDFINEVENKKKGSKKHASIIKQKVNTNN